MAGINTTVRRWCETCGRFTRSAMNMYGEEVCAECDEPQEEAGGGAK